MKGKISLGQWYAALLGLGTHSSCSKNCKNWQGLWWPRHSSHSSLSNLPPSPCSERISSVFCLHCVLPLFPSSFYFPPCFLLQTELSSGLWLNAFMHSPVVLNSTVVHQAKLSKSCQKEMTVWYFPSFWGYLEGKDGEFIRGLPKRQDNETEAVLY